MERPALRQLLAHIREGLVDTVVVYKIDRLTRSLADFVQMVELFDAHNVSFVAITQQFNTTTSMGQLTLNVLLSFAQFEREVIGERIRDKVDGCKRKGMWMGGTTPMGYDVRERKLVVNPHEAGIVKQIYERYLELRSVLPLKRDLDQRRIVSAIKITRKGNPREGKPSSRGPLQIDEEDLSMPKKAHREEHILPPLRASRSEHESEGNLPQAWNQGCESFYIWEKKYSNLRLIELAELVAAARKHPHFEVESATGLTLSLLKTVSEMTN